MKIKKLTLNNFRQFYGEHSIEFSVQSGKTYSLFMEKMVVKNLPFECL